LILNNYCIFVFLVFEYIEYFDIFYVFPFEIFYN
jgi:hypothetical protein